MVDSRQGWTFAAGDGVVIADPNSERKVVARDLHQRRFPVSGPVTAATASGIGKGQIM